MKLKDVPIAADAPITTQEQPTQQGGQHTSQAVHCRMPQYQHG